MRTRSEQERPVRGRRPKLVLNAGLLLMALSTIAATAEDDALPTSFSESESDCLEVTLYYWVLDENEEKQYVLGPDRCVVSTPWEERSNHGFSHSSEQLDSGAGFLVRVPRPTIPPS